MHSEILLPAILAATLLGGCERQQPSSGPPVVVEPARADSAGPGGSTGPRGAVPAPDSGGTAVPGVTGQGSAPGHGDRGAKEPGYSTGGLAPTTPAGSTPSKGGDAGPGASRGSTAGNTNSTRGSSTGN